ncbi:hypothetical protein PGT21_032423 [Puccinia graminis f. sp. tritici]|uniref:Uncharacterized protein n=1 Tax=Puccinia graminis f. sp. tritici TaxID=56615 RepID=A0A5B0QZ88_PUCGR|nr:hypothetical protein PGT21_032423 [Puccinia graminis f. sp. tritici]
MSDGVGGTIKTCAVDKAEICTYVVIESIISADSGTQAWHWAGRGPDSEGPTITRITSLGERGCAMDSQHISCQAKKGLLLETGHNCHVRYLEHHTL